MSVPLSNSQFYNGFTGTITGYSNFSSMDSLMTTLTKKVDTFCKESPQLQNCSNFNTHNVRVYGYDK